MQNSHPFIPSSLISAEPSLAEDAGARSDEPTRIRSLGGEPRPGELFAAFAQLAHEHPDEQTRSRGPTAPRAAAPRDHGERTRDARGDAGERVTFDELLVVLRDPIHWTLARAERHAHSDPVDVAAVGRVRTAYQHRLVAIGTGGAFGDARAKVRASDLLTVAGLLVRSLDPAFVQRASMSARARLLDALARVLPLDLTQAPDNVHAPRPAALLCYLDEIVGALAPFGTPHTSCAAAPSCPCGHHHVR